MGGPRGGAFAFYNEFSDVEKPPPLGPPIRLRDQTDYCWPVMCAYLETMARMLGAVAGPLFVSFDGVQADGLGELNSYWCIGPARPWAGVVERRGWFSIQERGE